MEIVKHTPQPEKMEMAKMFVESKMFDGISQVAQAFVKIQAGAEIGLSPFASMSGIHIIKGKVSIGAGLMAGCVKGSGKYDYLVTKMDEAICTIDFLQGGKVIGTSSFTIAEAKKAGTQNLDKFPRNMLFARAMSNGVKWFTPDVFTMPVYTPEEMGDVCFVEDVQHEVVEPDTLQAEELASAIAGLELANSKKDLTDFKKTLPAYIVSDASFTAAGKARYEVIMATAVIQ